MNWSVDLSAYAGQQVELAIAYVSDWATQGIGVFLDDVDVFVDGTSIDTDPSFEAGLGSWTVSGSPEGSGRQLQRLAAHAARPRGGSRAR